MSATKKLLPSEAKRTTAKQSFLVITFCALAVTAAVAFCLLGRFSDTILNPHRSLLGCVKIADIGQSTEGIGAILLRNQEALFIAESHRANIAFPPILSDHGYAIQDMFDTCPEPPQHCQVRIDDMVLYRCPRADCNCLRQQIARYVADKTRTCPVLGVENNRIRTLEYSGCLGGILSRYLGTTSKPTMEYDAIHYRFGDLAQKGIGKRFSLNELWYLLSAMCKISDRDIVIVTEGNPKIPNPTNCWNRLILASDTTVHEAFRILQHAKTISVGTSSFALMMTELASPMHMVVLERTASRYEWVDCKQWTIVGERGALFHFESKKMMLDTVLGGEGVKTRSHRTKKQESRNSYELGVPSRIWNPKKMWGSIQP